MGKEKRPTSPELQNLSKKKAQFTISFFYLCTYSIPDTYKNKTKKITEKSDTTRKIMGINTEINTQTLQGVDTQRNKKKPPALTPTTTTTVTGNINIPLLLLTSAHITKTALRRIPHPPVRPPCDLGRHGNCQSDE